MTYSWHRWLLVGALCCGYSAAAAWTIQDEAHTDKPGRAITFRYDDRIQAQFIYGEGQLKPYLAVFDRDGRRLTNPGIDAKGKPRGRFPHHRGIFIGWNHIHSDLGRDDLWHLRSGETMKLVSIETDEATSESAELEVLIHWNSAQAEGDARDGLLIQERRRIQLSRKDDQLRIDHVSELNAVRDARLSGDLQHAGLHFRADADVDAVRDQTRYLWSPADLPPGNGRVIHDQLEWVHFRFPLHGYWYAITQMNHPANQATELSWRDYGRFGFFRTAELKAGESLVFSGRFLVERLSDHGDDEQIHRAATASYEQYLRVR